MTLFDELPIHAARSEPLVWLRRLVLYGGVDPVSMIRDIRLHTGMNIVWGIESESASEPFTPGHGVGKTTFCRLIRYCLGELRFGQKHVCEEVQNTFPAGYVAAEVCLDREVWSLLRPFNPHRASYARRDVTVEQLLADRGTPHSFSQFRELLSAKCLHSVPAEGALSSGGNIEWDHLLAMCSRDQEARYQSGWQWRSSRSDSGTPAFKQPRNDALVCVRAVLGLLGAEETELRRVLREAEKSAAELDEQITQRQREPEYWVRHYCGILRRDFDIADAEVASRNPGELHSVPALVRNREAALEAERDRLSTELGSLERQIAIASVAWQEPAELHEQFEAAAEATEAGTATLVAEVEETEALRQMIVEAQTSFCKYGRIPISECSYAIQAVARFDDDLQKARLENVPEAARRAQAAASLHGRKTRLSEKLHRSRQALDGLIETRRRLNDERHRVADNLLKLRQALRDLQAWDELKTGRVKDSELFTLGEKKRLAAVTEEATSGNLKRLLEEQNDRVQQVRAVFDSLVKNTLSDDFKGFVEIGTEDLVFRIVRGESLSGEAFETLAILLADLTILFLGAFGLAAHPGLLLHDSPREADLGATIYRRFLRCVATSQRDCAHDGAAAFQYILTTTTEPPDELRAPETTVLPVEGEHWLLFHRQLATRRHDPQQTLFPEDAG